MTAALRIGVLLAMLSAPPAAAMDCLVEAPGPRDLSRPARFLPCAEPPPSHLGACAEFMRGATFEFDLEGRTARVWVGLAGGRDGGGEVAIESFTSTSGPGACTALSTGENEVATGALSITLKPSADPAIPVVHLDAFGQSGCTSYVGGAQFACLLLAERCEWLEPWHGGLTSRGPCMEPAEAATAATRAAEVQARSAEAAETIHKRGLAAFRKKNWVEAERLFREAAPRSVAALNDLGFLCYRQKRLAESERVLLQTVLRDGSRAVAWLNLGDLYWDGGKPAAARRAYQRYLQVVRGNLHEGEQPIFEPRALKRAGSATH